MRSRLVFQTARAPSTTRVTSSLSCYTEGSKGTSLEGKLTFSVDDTLGNGFSEALRSQQVDLLFGVGWTGAALIRTA
ncbi:MAG: hypothetical protein ACLS3U_07360 [Lachnospiraceae bacterium]